MSETKLIPTTDQFLQPLQEFEQKQIALVKGNPFIEISDTKTYEAAKKSRTALVKGRTELQKQQKTINDSVNSIKSAVKTETERLIEIYRELAKGGAGLIITGIFAVYKKAISPHYIIGNYDDSFIPELKKISQTVHESDKDCKVIAQLHHPGRQIPHPEDMKKLIPYFPQV